MVGNVAIAGADTRSRLLVKSVDQGGRVFLRDNIAVSATGAPIAMTDDDAEQLRTPPAWWSGAIPSRSPAQSWQAMARVLRTSGARPARRDPIDVRIVRSVIDGSGTIVDSQEQVGGYPAREQTARVLAVPDEVEARRAWLEGLSRALENDATLDLAPLAKRLGIPSLE